MNDCPRPNHEWQRKEFARVLSDLVSRSGANAGQVNHVSGRLLAHSGYAPPESFARDELNGYIGIAGAPEFGRLISSGDQELCVRVLGETLLLALIYDPGPAPIALDAQVGDLVRELSRLLKEMDTSD